MLQYSIISRIHANTTKLCNITCTLVATGVILRSLKCIWRCYRIGVRLESGHRHVFHGPHNFITKAHTTSPQDFGMNGIIHLGYQCSTSFCRMHRGPCRLVTLPGGAASFPHMRTQHVAGRVSYGTPGFVGTVREPMPRSQKMVQKIRRDS
jgi:hypothetical protein